MREKGESTTGVSGVQLRRLITERIIPAAFAVEPDPEDPLATARENTTILYAAVEARGIQPPIIVGEGVSLTTASELRMAAAGILASVRAEHAALGQPEV